MIKKFRLCKQTDFQNTIKGKTRMKTDSFSIILNKNNQNKSARYGISVSKKLGNAVVRNRVKRQVRSMIDEIDLFKEKVDVIIVIKDGYFSKTYFQNKAILENMLKQTITREVKR